MSFEIVVNHPVLGRVELDSAGTLEEANELAEYYYIHGAEVIEVPDPDYEDYYEE